MSKKDWCCICERKLKYVMIAPHGTCVNKTDRMMMEKFLNMSVSANEYVYRDIYQACLKLLRILLGNHGGDLFLLPTPEKYYGLLHLVQEDEDSKLMNVRYIYNTYMDVES